jgi:choline kinase
MQVVLLAAGLGSRLGTLTERLPKALIHVAGESLLTHSVRFARRLDPTEIVLVGGFGFLDVASEVARLSSAVTLIENRNFRDGNLISLMAARERVREDFLLMNVDHIYRPAIAAQVEIAATAVATDEITAFVDEDRQLGPDDMKVARDLRRHVRAISKTLTQFDCGYVGMTLVTKDALRRYWDAADEVLATEGRAVHVERILARLADSNQPPACHDVSGIGWLEVDLQDERAHAESLIRAAPAAWR